eukprot:jgi/Tetstr1/463512/TSEL_008391.t1
MLLTTAAPLRKGLRSRADKGGGGYQALPLQRAPAAGPIAGCSVRLYRSLRCVVSALQPRWWAASPVNLAVVRIVVVWLVLDWLDGSVDFVDVLAAGQTEGARDVLVSRELPIAWPSPATSFGLNHVHALRLLLWLSLLGAAAPASLAGAAVMAMRCRAAEIALHKDGGHSNDFYGPMLLLLAGSPCSDELSVDALVASVRAAWATGCGGVRGLTGAVLAASRSWAQQLPESCHRRSRAYSAPLIFAALYLGLFYLSAGLSKAVKGDTFIWSWALGGHIQSNALGMWLRRWGEPRLPTLGAFLTKPLRAAFSLYLYPVLRFDKVPGFLEAGGAVAVAWECLHWYLLLCGPWVRALSMLTMIGFHLFVACYMSISFRPLVALQLALFIPWDVLLDRLLLRTKPSGAKLEKASRMASPAPGISQRPLVWLTIAVGVALVVGQSLSVREAIFPTSGPRKRCFPFDEGPSFRDHGQAKPSADGSYVWKPDAARLLSRHVVLHLEGGAPPVRYPVWQAVCIVGGYKKRCMRPQQGTVGYWCCDSKKKAYPHDLMKTFVFNVHRLDAKIPQWKFQRLGMLALAEPGLLPPGEARNVTAVSIESTPTLIMRGQATADEVMADAQPTMECEELVMRPGTEADHADLRRTCQPPPEPAQNPRQKPGTSTTLALPQDLGSGAKGSQIAAPPSSQNKAAGRPRAHRLGLTRRRHKARAFGGDAGL